jgi:hypothetical protein
MHKITQDSFQSLLDRASIRPRVKREVRFVSSIAGSEDMWDQLEMVPISDRAGNKGVLLMEAADDAVFVASYELKRGITSSTGKSQPIICDFCRTWQTGSRSGSITLDKPERNAGSITFLCCADLQCSRHVRNLTSAAKTSRSQLREDMNSDQRIARLKSRLQEIAGLLGLTPIVI